MTVETEFTGTDRRNETNKALKSMAKSYDALRASMAEISMQVTQINGRVGRGEEKLSKHEEKIKSVSVRIGQIENNELLAEGFKKGSEVMKTSTRNLIILITTIIVCLCSGVTVFMWSQRSTRESIEAMLKISQQCMMNTFEGRAVQPADVKDEVSRLRRELFDDRTNKKSGGERE